jgi:hypothetical protein
VGLGLCVRNGLLQLRVARYQAEGFGRPHPIPTREKGPVIKGWQDPEKTFGLEEFVLTS